MNIPASLFKRKTAEDKELQAALKNLLGFTPKFLTFYIIALTHSSQNDQTAHNNERLEFLGDAFLGSIVAEYLFKKYPQNDEGFLTEMRSKIVSRNSLNEIARKMGLRKIVRFNHQDKILQRSQIFGNALEALIGAIYLDVGFKKTRRFIIKQILSNYVDMDMLENTEYNFKNKIYTWAQKNGKEIQFITLGESIEAGRKVFSLAIMVDDVELVRATGYTKKEAGQRAAEMASELIGTEKTK